jgi:hypothetical protein
MSLSKYEDNSDPIPRSAVVLAACSTALAEVLLDREGVEEIQEPIPDELEHEAPAPSNAKILPQPAPSNAKILPQPIFFLPIEGCCADFCNLTVPNLLLYMLNMVASSALTSVK